HVWEATLRHTVRLLQPSHFEQSAECPLPVRNGRFRFSVSAPEEVTGIWLWTGRHVANRLGNMVWQRDVHRHPRLRLIEKKIVVGKKSCLFERCCVADTQPAP